MKNIKLTYLLSLLAMVTATTSITTFANSGNNFGKSCEPSYTDESDRKMYNFYSAEIRLEKDDSGEEDYKLNPRCVYRSSYDATPNPLTTSIIIKLEQAIQARETVQAPEENSEAFVLFYDRVKKEFGWRCTSPSQPEKCSFNIHKAGRTWSTR